MGWYKDNFPGSPAQRQRTLISRGIVIYTLVTGAAIYFFAPLCRRLRKEFAEGRELQEFDWLAGRRDLKRIENQNILSSQPTLEEFMEVQQVKDKEKRGDFRGPNIAEETMRKYIYSKR